MDIRNPRRALLIGPPDSGVLELLKDLTGSAPAPRPAPVEDTIPECDTDATQERTSPQTTTAGLTHVLSLETKYYKASVPVWLDEIQLASDAVTSWIEDFTSSSAAEVVRAIGAWILVFRFRDVLDTAKSAELKRIMNGVKEVIGAGFREEGGEEAWDGVLLAVGTGGGLVGKDHEAIEESAKVEEWEDACFAAGFEFVDARQNGRSQLVAEDQRGKTGVERVLEALEVNDWSIDDDVDADGNDEYDIAELDDMKRGLLDEESLSLEGLNIEGLNSEDGWLGSGEDEDTQVEKLEQMMRRMQAARDAGAQMSERERKRLAARTVNDILRGI